MTTKIPDAVLTGILHDDEGFNLGGISVDTLRGILARAEDKFGWKLCPRVSTDLMKRPNAYEWMPTDIWRLMWDAAPSAKET